MSRADRRRESAKLDRFKRGATGGLDTCLVAAGTPLDGHPRAKLFAGAIADALRHPAGLQCVVCAQPLGPKRGFGGWLLWCAEVRPTSAAISTICAPCWRDCAAADIEVAATRVLQRLIAGGRFEPAVGPTP